MSSRQTPNLVTDQDSQTGRGGYNKLRTTVPTTKSNPDPHGGKREQAHTTTPAVVSGHDLTKYLTREKQYAGLDPMQRFLREGGSALSRKADKGHRL